jgi:tRNA A-37 threonylcarbamoyl transferase component Bud32
MALSRARLVPYKYGHKYTLREHIAKRRVEGDGLFLLSPSDAALYASKEALYCNRQSDSGRTGSEWKEITFEGPIRTGRECGSQIIMTTEGCVAKIYDPLSYRFMDTYFERQLDVVKKAKYDYKNESRAYSALRAAGLCGKAVPDYLGSWTITVADPTADGKDREVHLILLECIEGVAMSEVPVEALSDATREGIMVEVIEAITDVHIAGVDHRNCEPHNIIIFPENYESLSLLASNQNSHSDGALRVCVIDFSLSYTREPECGMRKGYPCRACIAEPRRNPLYFWAGADQYCQYGWLPQPWAEAANWMWKIWGELRKGKYKAVKRNEASYLGKPLPIESD